MNLSACVCVVSVWLLAMDSSSSYVREGICRGSRSCVTVMTVLYVYKAKYRESTHRQPPAKQLSKYS